MVRELSRDYRLWIPSFGHAGDGNIHVHLMIDPNDEDGRVRLNIGDWQDGIEQRSP